MTVFKTLMITAAMSLASTAHAETAREKISISIDGIDFSQPAAERIAFNRVARASRQFCETPVRHFGPSARKGERACRTAINEQGLAAIRERLTPRIAAK